MCAACCIISVLTQWGATLVIIRETERESVPAPWRPEKCITVGVCLLQRVFFLIPFVPRLARACHTGERLAGCSPLVERERRGDARGGRMLEVNDAAM